MVARFKDVILFPVIWNSDAQSFVNVSPSELLITFQQSFQIKWMDIEWAENISKGIWYLHNWDAYSIMTASNTSLHIKMEVHWLQTPNTSTKGDENAKLLTPSIVCKSKRYNWGWLVSGQIFMMQKFYSKGGEKKRNSTADAYVLRSLPEISGTNSLPLSRTLIRNMTSDEVISLCFCDCSGVISSPPLLSLSPSFLLQFPVILSTSHLSRPTSVLHIALSVFVTSN